MFNFVCKILNIPTLEEEYKQIEIIEQSILEKGIFITNLAKEHQQFRFDCNSNIQIINDQIKKGGNEEDLNIIKQKINEKYNNFYSEYLDRLKPIIEDTNLLKAQKEGLLNLNPKLQTISERKKEIEEKGLKYKQFMNKSLNRERHSMPQIDKENLDSFLIHFSDKAKVSKKKISLKKIKPSQKDMNEEKILNMSMDQNFNGKNFPYIISEDNFLMDGHHSWASELEKDEDGEVDVYRVHLPIKDLLRRANMLNIAGKKDKSDKVIQVPVKEFEKAITVLHFSADNEEKIDYLKTQLEGFNKVIYLGKNGINEVIYEKIN